MLKAKGALTYPESHYVAERDGCLYVSGSRVSLDSVVVEFQRGASPEAIVEAFPTLGRAQVYGAIAYYLEHQATVDAYLAEGEQFFANAPKLRDTDPELFARLENARRQMFSR